MACVTSGAETPTYSSMNTSEESWTAKPTTSAAGSAGSILPTRSISPTPAWARVLHGERRREVAAVSPQPGREVHGLTGDEQLLQPGPDEALGDEWVPAGGCRPGRGRAARCGPAAVPEPATAVSPRRSLPQQARAASESGRDPADHVAWAIAHAVVSEGDLGTVKWEPSPRRPSRWGSAVCAASYAWSDLARGSDSRDHEDLRDASCQATCECEALRSDFPSGSAGPIRARAAEFVVRSDAVVHRELSRHSDDDGLR
jgi:hypothetical protein